MDSILYSLNSNNAQHFSIVLLIAIISWIFKETYKNLLKSQEEESELLCKAICTYADALCELEKCLGNNSFSNIAFEKLSNTYVFLPEYLLEEIIAIDRSSQNIKVFIEKIRDEMMRLKRMQINPVTADTRFFIFSFLERLFTKLNISIYYLSFMVVIAFLILLAYYNRIFPAGKPTIIATSFMKIFSISLFILYISIAKFLFNNLNIKLMCKWINIVFVVIVCAAIIFLPSIWIIPISILSAMYLIYMITIIWLNIKSKKSIQK